MTYLTISRASDIEKRLWNQAASQNLSNHIYWLKLLHYYSPGESLGQWSTRSDVVTPNFFLHPDGNRDPSAELKATLTAILEPPDEDLNHHARCRFIARTQWLKEKLDFPELAEIRCPLFESWANLDEATEMNIIFVSAFLENPASAFGHILIQFNTKNRYFSHTLLSPTLNFGAIPDPEDGAIEYGLRGLFGGYSGGFSDERFYNFNHMYGENEQRDLWSYPLHFSETQRKRITYHTWELLQQVKFTYYFFLDNCAYRMAELLEMAWTDDTRLNTPGALWSIPIYVIQNLKGMTVDEGSLLGIPELIPSRQRRLQRSVKLLEKIEREWLRRLVRREKDPEDEELLELLPESRARIFDAWIDYLQFEHEGKFEGKVAKLRNRILNLRSRLPILDKAEQPEDPSDPSRGSNPTRFRFGVVQNSQLSPAYEFGFWTSHHDLLGEESGHLSNAELVTLDIRLHLRDNSTSIKSITLFSIQNLVGNPTGIPGDSGLAWRLKAGWEKEQLDCRNCKHFIVSGGLGKSASLSSRDAGYAFIELFGKTPRASWPQTSWGTAPHLGLLWSPLEGWKMQLEAGWFRSFAGPKQNYTKGKFHQRWTLAQNWDLRLEYERIGTNREGAFALSYYW